MARNIAVVGPLRSGKDSIADYLVTNHGYTRMALADPLKDEVVTALNAVDGGTWTRARLEEDKKHLRPLLQVWGTELRRNSDPDYWVRRLERTIGAHHAADRDRIVVTDARFRNELNMLERHSFVIVQLVMEDKALRAHLKKVAGMSAKEITAALAHPSEQEWRDYTAHFYVASVPGELDSLIREVAEIAVGKEADSE